MSPGSSCAGSGSNGFTRRPETVCRYGPATAGASSGKVVTCLRLSRPSTASAVLGSGRKPVAVGVGDRLCPIACAGLAVEVVDVALHRGFGDGETLGDLGVGE